MAMALSFGIPLGLVIAITGAILFFITKSKVVSGIVIVIGAAIFLLTFVLMYVVVFSDM